MATSEMNITDRESAYLAEFARTFNAGNDVLASEVDAREASAVAWNNIVDNKLIEWGSTRSEFEDDGLVGPSYEAIGTALKFVKKMRKESWPLPTGVIPDGEGGIVFENRRGDLYQRIEIDQNGRTGLATFRDCKLVERASVEIE
ncbi:MAG: hypothetical protein WD669_01050 [Pirellulales bacterium]